MANISSFYGTLYFEKKDIPWTPEGFLLAYDVLLSMDASGGGYGFALDEEAVQDSAAFLEDLLSQESLEPSLPFFGNGRWAAAGNFDSFEAWSKEKADWQEMSEETYKSNRAKLLKLMEENDWAFRFEYKDEEGGMGFIVEQTATITVSVFPEHERVFVCAVDTIGDYAYNLRNFSEVMEDGRFEDRFWEVQHQIAEVLNICTDDDIRMDRLQKFIELGNWDTLLPPYPYFEDANDLPENFKKAWEKYEEEQTSSAEVV